MADGTWVRLAVQNFTSIGARGGNAAPNIEKFPLFGKESPRRGEPFDRFLESSSTPNYPALVFQF